MFGWIESLFRAPAAGEKKASAQSPRMDLGLRQIKGSFIEVEGLPQPQWELISHELGKRHPGADQETLWHSASYEWLETLRSALGERFRIHESQNFLYLTAKSGGSQRYLRDCAEKGMQQLLSYFGEAVLHEPAFGKHVIIFLDDLDTYYRYISHFYFAGEHPGSGGMFINAGYRHVVLTPSDHQYHALLIHELSHCAAAPLSLPKWVNEGLAQWMEGSVAGLHPPIDRELHARHRDFWNAVTIQRFWSGVSFQEVGDGVELSYSLADILMRRLHVDFPDEVRRFAAAADWKDSGEAAATTHLQINLGELASRFLGPGEWERLPAPPEAPGASIDHFDGKWPLLLEFVRAGRVEDARPLWENLAATAPSDNQAFIFDALACIPLHYECDHFVQEAMRLNERSIALAPSTAEFHTTRGGLLLKAGKLEAAKAVLEKIASGPHATVDRAVAFYFLASTELGMGSRERAEAAFEEAVKLAPDLGLRSEIEIALDEGLEGKMEAEV